MGNVVKDIMSSVMSPVMYGVIRDGGSAKTYLNIGMFGSSNVGASARDDTTLFPAQYGTFDANMLKLDHTNALRAFSTPLNNDYGVTTYSLVNEEMSYGVAESFITELRKLTTRKIAVCPNFDSGQPVGYALSAGTKGWVYSRDSGDPFNLLRQYGQVITRLQALQTETSEPLDVIYMPDCGKDASYGAASVPVTVIGAYKDLVANLKTDLNLPSTTIFILPNLGPSPSNSATYPKWDALRTAIDAESGFGSDVFVINPVSDLSLTVEDHVQWEYTVTSRSGTWTIGENITGGTSGEVGRLATFSNSANTIWMEEKPETGFTNGETLTGATSGATATATVSTTNPATVHYNTKGLNRIGLDAARLTAAVQ